MRAAGAVPQRAVAVGGASFVGQADLMKTFIKNLEEGGSGECADAAGQVRALEQRPAEVAADEPGAPQVGIPQVGCDDVVITKVLGTVLADDYPPNAGEIAMVGPYMITDACWCMELCHFYDTENRFDGGNVKISTDGGATWTLVAPSRLYDDVGYSSNACIPLEEVFTGHTYSTVFHQDCFDVSAFGGMDIWVGFFFGSDGSVGYYPGWYIKWLKIGSDDSTPVEESSWGHIKAMYR